MKRRLLFDSAAFGEITEELRNPARGWYQVYSFRAEQQPDLEDLIWCLRESETCALVLLDIGAYRDRVLDETALTHMRQLFFFFNQHKKDMILRIVYDREGKGPEHEPSLFSQVMTHIRQLKPLFQEYRQRIILFEGMLVGSWGEMHSSKFLAKKHLLQLNEALADSAAGIMRAVRRPVQWRMLHQALPTPETTVGLYNDAIFGSDTDLGTFAPEGSEGANWEEPWPAAQELAFEERLGEFVPQCGEAVYEEGYDRHTLSSTAERLRKMRLDCLNGVYDENILRIWKDWAWDGPDVWHGINGYDYIGRHLGYRFCVRSAAAKPEGGSCTVTLTVQNVGFSGFYQEAEVSLILTDREGRQQDCQTDWDIRKWRSGQICSLAWKIPCREGALYLSARRKWDRETIWFANRSTDEGWVPLGELKGS